MKKLIITITIILSLGLTSFADPNGGGLFLRGSEPEYSSRDASTPMMPDQHGYTGDADGDGTTVPVGSGALFLLGFGAAYAFAKKRREE